jgi:hypothetical protein
VEVAEKSIHRDRKERRANLGERLGFRVRKEFDEKGSRCDVVWRDDFGGRKGGFHSPCVRIAMHMMFTL